MLKTSTTQTQRFKIMKTRIIKDNGDCKREMVLIHENEDTGTKIYSEKDGIGVLAAFFDHDSLDSSAQWFESREALEEAYPGTLPQEDPISYELRSAKYDAATNSTRIVYAPEDGTAAEAKEDVIYHDSAATETERADEIDAFIAAQ
jgi:hypothetical protein